MSPRRSVCFVVALVVGVACNADATVAQGADAIATIRYHDGSEVRVLALQPDPVTPPGPLAVTLEVAGAGSSGALEVALWPPRIGGRELVLGSGVDRELAARLDDPRVSRASVVGDGLHDVALALPSEWSPRTAMITVERRSGDSRIDAVAGPRTRDGLGTAGLVDVVFAPRRISATALAEAPVVDGALDDAAWAGVPTFDLGDSLEGETRTDAAQVRFGWTADTLFVGAWLADTDVWSEYTKQDDPLWKEEVFELFLLGDGSRARYLELQVSPRSVTFDARFDTYRKGDEAWDGPWSGAAVVEGRVDRRDDRDRGWSVELAVPLSMICEHTTTGCPMAAGSTTRINAFWIDRPRRGPTAAWSIAPTRVPDFHAPEAAAVLELAP